MASPMSADQLVRVLRAEGCRVVEYRSWRTHNRNHKGAWGPINAAMFHHTVTSGTDGTVRLCYEGYAGLPGPLCHGVIAKDGTVYLVGNGRANHAGLGDDNVLQAVIEERRDLPAPNERNTDGNARFYGFEAINMGDGEDPWPDAQLEAIERAGAAICRHYGWKAESVLGHKEWSYTKIDPRGFSMEEMRGRINNRLAGPAGVQEDDMPSVKEIADAVYDKLVNDDAFPVPAEWGSKPGNDRWMWRSIVASDGSRLRRIEARQAAQDTVLRELAAALAARDDTVDVEAVVARIEAAIENIEATVTVDVDTPEGN